MKFTVLCSCVRLAWVYRYSSNGKREHFISSASNTVTKTLGAVDNVVDGVSLATEMFKDAMVTARLEQQIESMVESNKLLAESGLPEEQILMLKASL